MSLIEQIKKWALENYEIGGSWIVETFTDEEIAQEFKTLAQAKKYAKTIRAREQECQGW